MKVHLIFFKNNAIQEALAQDLRSKATFTREMGLIHNDMEDQLKVMKIERQAYHSNSFVGNHVNKALKVYVFFKMVY